MIICMRTTLNLDDDLVRAAKREAVRSGRSLTAVIEDALRQMLAPRSSPGRGPDPFRITPFDGHGLQAGVDLDDGAALLDLMERSE